MEQAEDGLDEPGQKQARGKIDENMILKYVEGDCTRAEKLKVEGAMDRDKTLRECIALVRAIIPNGTMLSNEEIGRLDFDEIRRSAHRETDKPR